MIIKNRCSNEDPNNKEACPFREESTISIDPWTKKTVYICNHIFKTCPWLLHDGFKPIDRLVDGV